MIKKKNPQEAMLLRGVMPQNINFQKEKKIEELST